MASRPIPEFTPRGQRGAVLYVAMIMLILLALIGIAGMQVAGIQERMSSSYRAINRAFQNSEGVAREAECAIEAIVNRTAPGDCSVIGADDITELCEDFDPVAWAEEQSFAAVPAVNVRKIDRCPLAIGEEEIGMGTGPVNEQATSMYQITSYAADDEDNASSSAVIDTIFKL